MRREHRLSRKTRTEKKNSRRHPDPSDPSSSDGDSESGSSYSADRKSSSHTNETDNVSLSDTGRERSRAQNTSDAKGLPTPFGERNYISCEL